MKSYALSGGAMLRQLRKKRHLTLQHVASRFSTSVASLSRKERGVEVVNRQDIRNAVRVYQLPPAEAAELWAAAGLLPDPPVNAPAQIDLESFAGPLLINLLFPAFVVDALGYIRAWNQPYEHIWQLDGQSQRPHHVISNVFSVRFRAMLGDEWHQSASTFVNSFYRDTLTNSGHPNYAPMIRMLEQRHGSDFIRMWNEASHKAAAAVPNAFPKLNGMRVVYGNDGHDIEYLLMQSSFNVTTSYVLLIQVPFGLENQIRYEALAAGMGPPHVYFDE